MDAEIYEVLNSYKQAIDVLLAEIDGVKEELKAQKEEQDKLHSVLFDELLEPARLALEERERSDRFDEFNEKYGERMEPYTDTLSKVYDEPDYSFVQDAFDQYDAMEPKPEADDFVDAIIEKAETQIDDIKERLGIADGVEVEIKQDEDGNTEVVADGEVVASEEEKSEEEPTEEDGTEATAEDVAIEEQPELGFDDEEEPEVDPEELKKFEEELSKAL